MDTDVIIVGAGVAGSFTSIAIRQRISTKIVLIDSRNFSSPSFKVGESLPALSKPILAELGVLNKLQSDTQSGIHKWSEGISSSWGDTNRKEIDSIFNPYGNGFILDRSLFELELINHITTQKSPNMTVMQNCFVTSLTRVDNQWIVQIEKEGEQLIVRGKFLVDASGRKSIIRLFGKEKKLQLDRLIAFIAEFEKSIEEATEDNDSKTLVESVEDGWWYTAVLPNKSRVVVFHTDDDLPSARTSRKPEEFLEKLSRTKHVSQLISKYQLKSKISVTSASTSILSKLACSDDNWLAVGDSAMSFDPLSSQGMLTAMQCALLAGNVIEDVLTNFSTTSSKLLNEYEQRLLQIFYIYMKKKDHYYSNETRFVSPFWDRRRVINK